MIGMEGSVLDEDAIKFTGGFYGAYSSGASVQEAFTSARWAVKLESSVFEAVLLQRSPPKPVGLWRPPSMSSLSSSS